VEGNANRDLALDQATRKRDAPVFPASQAKGWSVAKLDLAKGPKQGTKQLQGGFLEPSQRLATQPNKPIAFLKQFYNYNML
jgi:hypothetical protein